MHFIFCLNRSFSKISFKFLSVNYSPRFSQLRKSQGSSVLESFSALPIPLGSKYDYQSEFELEEPCSSLQVAELGPPVCYQVDKPCHLPRLK